MPATSASAACRTVVRVCGLTLPWRMAIFMSSRQVTASVAGEDERTLCCGVELDRADGGDVEEGVPLAGSVPLRGIPPLSGEAKRQVIFARALPLGWTSNSPTGRPAGGIS